MKTSNSLATLAPALVKASAELRAITKDSTNPHFRSTYASLDTIIDTVRPVLARHGLTVLQGASSPHTDEHGRLTAFTVETLLLHASGEFISNAVVMPVGKADPQGAGAAVTYGRRYALAAMLSLATEEDDDGNSAMPTPKQQAQQIVRAAAEPARGPLADAVERVTQHAKQQTQAVGDDPACPTCGGRMWDNREGKKNPKAPDFKCRDKQCDGVIWPPKNGAAPKAAPQPAPVTDPDGFDIEAYVADDSDLPF